MIKLDKRYKTCLYNFAPSAIGTELQFEPVTRFNLSMHIHRDTFSIKNTQFLSDDQVLKKQQSTYHNLILSLIHNMYYDSNLPQNIIIPYFQNYIALILNFSQKKQEEEKDTNRYDGTDRKSSPLIAPNLLD